MKVTSDYGEPVYVEAHGGKNHVIMYRSRTNPDLAMEFFFRSSSKDGRSRYYRCTKCWYKYKLNRGTCATLIVRDGRIITDPENPVVPHQCEFRTVDSVTANRAWIASRKRTPKNSNQDEPGPSTPTTPGFKTSIIPGPPLLVTNDLWLSSMSSIESGGDEGRAGSGGGQGSMDGESGSADGERGSAPSSVSSKDVLGTPDGSSVIDGSTCQPHEQSCSQSRRISENPVWARLRERAMGQSQSYSINLACEESMGVSSPECSPSPECKFPSADEAGPSIVCVEPESPDECGAASSDSCLHQAFTASMQKRNDEALRKLQEAIDNNEPFDIDDISLVDNVFSYKFNNSADVQEKVCICEEWLNFLVKITPIATSRWLSHFQFSIYYTYHLLSIVFRHYDNQEEKRRFYKISLPLFTSLLQATAHIPETSEEVVNTKLDVLLSISFIAVLFCDVSDSEIERYIQREMRLLGTVAVGNYSTEASTLMVQKVYRIGNNLEERKRLLGITE